MKELLSIVNVLSELDNHNFRVAWTVGFITLCAFAILPWIYIIIVNLNKKYYLKYFVDGKLVKTDYYKFNQLIELYKYDNSTIWYLDEDNNNQFLLTNMPKKNIKLYKKIDN